MQITKKILLCSALVLAASSAMASDGTYNKSHNNGTSNQISSSFFGASNVYGKVSGSFGTMKNNSSTKEISVTTTSKNKFKSAKSFGIGAGMEVAEGLRAELMLNFFTKVKNTSIIEVDQVNKSSFSAFSPMLQAAYEFNTGIMVKPYVTAGIGIARVNYKLAITGLGVDPVSVTKKSTSFAYALGAGVSFDLAKSVALDVGYKYNVFTKGGKGSYKFALNNYSYTNKALKFSMVEAAVRFKL